MSRKDPKEEALELANQVGKPEARRLLVVAGISPHTADKLISGRYTSEVGLLVGAAIQRAIEAAKSGAA